MGGVEILGILSPLTVSFTALVLVIMVVLLLGLLRRPAVQADPSHPSARAGRRDPNEPRTPLWAHPLFWLGMLVLSLGVTFALSRYVPGVVLLLPLLFLRGMRWRGRGHRPRRDAAD